jgi:Tfp pilus assembly protein PilO
LTLIKHYNFMNPINLNLQKYLNFYDELKKYPFAKASASFLVCIFLILFLFIIAIQPSIITINNLQEKIAEMETLNQTLGNKAQALEKLVPEYQSMQSFIDKANAAIPQNPLFPELEKQIRFLVLKHQLNLDSISFSGFPLVEGENVENEEPQKPIAKTPLPKPEDYQELNLSINISGDYFAAKNFMADLQNLIRITSIDQINLELNKRISDGGVNIVLKSKAYYLNKI